MLSPSLRASANWQSMCAAEIRPGAAAVPAARSSFLTAGAGGSLAANAADGDRAATSRATTRPIPSDLIERAPVYFNSLSGPNAPPAAGGQAQPPKRRLTQA